MCEGKFDVVDMTMYNVVRLKEYVYRVIYMYTRTKWACVCVPVHNIVFIWKLSYHIVVCECMYVCLVIWMYAHVHSCVCACAYFICPIPMSITTMFSVHHPLLLHYQYVGWCTFKVSHISTNCDTSLYNLDHQYFSLTFMNVAQVSVCPTNGLLWNLLNKIICFDFLHVTLVGLITSSSGVSIDTLLIGTYEQRSNFPNPIYMDNWSFIGLKSGSRDNRKSLGLKLGHRNDFVRVSLRRGFFFFDMSFTQTKESLYKG